MDSEMEFEEKYQENDPVRPDLVRVGTGINFCQEKNCWTVMSPSLLDSSPPLSMTLSPQVLQVQHDYVQNTEVLECEELQDIKIKQLKEEHDLRMKYMKEEHDLRMKYTQEEHEWRQREHEVLIAFMLKNLGQNGSTLTMDQTGSVYSHVTFVIDPSRLSASDLPQEQNSTNSA
ncbi:unnamed protein product [Darwinula stevensoni]|uniref:Uncharacterized protein n=1 Tax=Darwinula stevensoni TaxID=69355 RepID=A0A7R9A7U6_9CRUS|nr:unnamed protein product [Darwinula stevensoni]CAG0893543.1 unnamed protein product [Darwinula stevensoni]